MPNHLNRSSLIAPIARGLRKFHRQAVMVSRSDCVLEYTGEQLDEADGEISAELLRKIERRTGKQQYEWLHRHI